MNYQDRLSAAHLITHGFIEVDSWIVSDGKLIAPRALPRIGGVYAFAIGDDVQYVGLASKSLRQRLNLYCNPSSSQLTNVRLNRLIIDLSEKEQKVRVLIAHPDDASWNGLRLRGAEGLEAALIEDFDLPWNVRGASNPKSAGVMARLDEKPKKRRKAQGTAASEIVAFVRKNPKSTELQIARGIFGPDAVQQRVMACVEIGR